MKALESVNAVLERWKCYWETFPEDRIELRTSWDTMDEIATDFYYSLSTVQDELATPAPIDWAQEATRRDEIRDKAIAYLTEAIMEVRLMPLPIGTGCTQVACFNERLEFSQKPPRELFRVVTAADLTIEQLLAVAAYVQKALSGK